MAIKVTGNIVINDSQAISNITTISANGNANVGNIGTAQVLATANVTAPQLISNIATGTAPLVVTSTTQVANLSVATAGTAGTVTTAAQPNITSVGTLTSLNVSGNGVISGNLTVDGDLVYVNVTSLAVEDPIIQLQTGPNGAAPSSNSGKDVGTGLNYYDTQARVAFMGWDVSNAEFGMASEASIASEVVTFSTYGNLRVGNIIGNGQALTGLNGSNVTGTVGSATTAGTVTTAAQPNITSVGTLSTLSVTGNANVGNIGTAQVLATANVTAPQLISNIATGTAPLVVTSTTTVGNLSVTSLQGNGPSQTATANSIVQRNADGNITANYYVGNGSQLTGISVGFPIANGTSNINAPAVNGNINISVAGTANVLVTTATGVNVAGTLNATGNANVGNIGTTTAIITTGNITTINSGLLQNGTSNVTVASGGNVSVFTAGNATARAIFTSTGANFAGTANVTGNANVGNIGTAQVLATANVIAPQLISNIATGTAPLVVTSTTQVANLSVATAGTAGTVTTAAQPNITSVGSLSTLTVTGNANVGNIGTAQVLATANVTAPQLISNIATGTAPLVVTSTTQVANLSVATAGTATSATTAATVTTAAQPNITSVGTLSGLTVSATITGSVSGSAATFTSTSQNSQFNSIGVNTGASGTAGEIRATNNITAYYSDERLKTEISKIDNALSKLLTLSGVYYRPNDVAQTFGYENKKQVGVLAQEVEKVLPEIVVRAPFDIIKNKDGVEVSKSGKDYKTVWYDKLIPLVIEAIKELKAEVDELKAK